MTDVEHISMIRKEHITLTPFAKKHLQMVAEIGHFQTLVSHIVRFDKPCENTYLIYYIAAGNAILAEKDGYDSLESNATLLRNCNEPFSIYLDDCEIYYAYITGEYIKEHVREERILFDLRFSKKTEIFFHSVFQSLDKYHIVDEFSIASSLLRLYSDVQIAIHDIVQCNDKQEVIDMALAFIEKHYQQDIRLKDISEAGGYSEYYFSRMFKEIMRMTPYEYLIRKRLSQVKILLLSTTMTIEEIALKCGFKSDISLYKTFKNVYSITPREYKKSVGK